jgi:hypothetical protein
MTRNPDGSVSLTREESEHIAKVLRQGRELATQLDAGDLQAAELVECKLLSTLDFLEELGVSADELTGKLDRRQESR